MKRVWRADNETLTDSGKLLQILAAHHWHGADFAELSHVVCTHIVQCQSGDQQIETKRTDMGTGNPPQPTIPMIITVAP